jgi:hypothetical protein
LKAIVLKIGVMSTFFLALLAGLYASNRVFFEDQLIDFYINESEACTQSVLSSENEVQATRHPNCVQGSFVSTSFNEPDINKFVSRVVARDFFGYQFSPAWEPIGHNKPGVDFEGVEWESFSKVVWLCGLPVKQYATVSTRLLALCSATPNAAGTGYDATVKIYELRPSIFGVLGRWIHEASASAQGIDVTSVLFSVEFRMDSGQLSAELVKHHLKLENEVKADTEVFVYKDKKLKYVFEFQSLWADPDKPLCHRPDGSPCPFVRRFFDLTFLDLINGGTIYAFETWFSEGSDMEPNDEGIPFVFDAKNWTLKRKFPRKPDEAF